MSSIPTKSLENLITEGNKQRVGYEICFQSVFPVTHIRSKTKEKRNCTAPQCSQLRQKFMELPIINTALSLLMKHVAIGQRQKALTFSGFHWSPHSSLLSIGQHFVATRVVH